MRIDRTYDALGRLGSVHSGGSLEPLISFAYGTLGPAIHRQDNLNGPTNGTEYSYDPLGRLEKIITRNAAGSVLARWRYKLALDGVPRVAVSKLGTLPELASVYTDDSAAACAARPTTCPGSPLWSWRPRPRPRPPTPRSSRTSEPGRAGSATTSTAATTSPGSRCRPGASIHRQRRRRLYPGQRSDPITTRPATWKNLGGTAYTYDPFGDLTYVDAGASTRRTTFETRSAGSFSSATSHRRQQRGDPLRPRRSAPPLPAAPRRDKGAHDRRPRPRRAPPPHGRHGVRLPQESDRKRRPRHRPRRQPGRVVPLHRLRRHDHPVTIRPDPHRERDWQQLRLPGTALRQAGGPGRHAPTRPTAPGWAAS